MLGLLSSSIMMILVVFVPSSTLGIGMGTRFHRNSSESSRATSSSSTVKSMHKEVSLGEKVSV